MALTNVHDACKLLSSRRTHGSNIFDSKKFDPALSTVLYNLQTLSQQTVDIAAKLLAINEQLELMNLRRRCQTWSLRYPTTPTPSSPLFSPAFNSPLTAGTLPPYSKRDRGLFFAQEERRPSRNQVFEFDDKPMEEKSSRHQVFEFNDKLKEEKPSRHQVFEFNDKLEEEKPSRHRASEPSDKPKTRDDLQFSFDDDIIARICGDKSRFEKDRDDWRPARYEKRGKFALSQINGDTVKRRIGRASLKVADDDAARVDRLGAPMAETGKVKVSPTFDLRGGVAIIRSHGAVNDEIFDSKKCNYNSASEL